MRLLLTTVLAAGTLAAMQSLPEGEGKKVIESQCGSCHTLDRVTRLNQDREKWNATVRQMVTFGASIPEAEIALAVDYLATHFGPRPASAPASEVERTANKHLEGICSTCHEASLIRETQATKEEWLDIVKRMNAKGAGLSEADVELLADYLARTYGRKP
jgi:mono/diheme cytochrome c family protein